jgi:hypothetical protein
MCGSWENFFFFGGDRHQLLPCKLVIDKLEKCAILSLDIKTGAPNG